MFAPRLPREKVTVTFSLSRWDARLLTISAFSAVYLSCLPEVGGAATAVSLPGCRGPFGGGVAAGTGHPYPFTFFPWR